MGFRYAYLKAVEPFGTRWEFEGKIYHDYFLVEMLNIIGKEGWKLVCKDSDYRYIMMM